MPQSVTLLNYSSKPEPDDQSPRLGFEPRAILFDLDDTLCDDASAWITCSQNAAVAIASELQQQAGGLAIADPRQLADIFLGISESYWFSWEAVKDARPIFEVRSSQWRQAMSESGEGDALRNSGATDEQITAIAQRLARDYGLRRSSEIALFPDVEPTLRALRNYGICLALITNGLASTHVEKVEQLGLESLFDHVIIAGVFGHFKPDRIIYDHALSLCGCGAGAALMVGDSFVNDVAGAQSAGIAAAWFNPQGLDRPDDAILPAAGELRSVGELLKRLKINDFQPSTT